MMLEHICRLLGITLHSFPIVETDIIVANTDLTALGVRLELISPSGSYLIISNKSSYVVYPAGI